MTTNDWPNPRPPIIDSSPDTPHLKNTRGAEKQEGFFSESIPNTLPEVIAPVRDDKGRFLTGNNGGGRKHGSRNRLTELFIKTIVEDFAEHGAATLERLRNEDPGFYLKMIAVLVPRALIHQYETEPPDYANMSKDEVILLLEEIQRRREIEKVIEAVSK